MKTTQDNGKVMSVLVGRTVSDGKRRGQIIAAVDTKRGQTYVIQPDDGDYAELHYWTGQCPWNTVD